MKFSHAIYENALVPELCRAAAKAWPVPSWPGWNAVYESDCQRKRACDQWPQMPQPCRELLSIMLALDVDHLGFGKLVPDFSLWGSGMHSLSCGGVLGLHLDADHHAHVNLRRVLNGILFLNPEWCSEWGGNLEIWDAAKTRSIVQIAPVFNRLVLFATGDDTWHGVPQTLTCPESVQRMTLATWWYKADEPSALARARAHFAETK